MFKPSRSTTHPLPRLTSPGLTPWLRGASVLATVALFSSSAAAEYGLEPRAFQEDWTDGYTLILTDAQNEEEASRLIQEIRQAGGRVGVQVSPSVMLGWVSDAQLDQVESLPLVRALHTRPLSIPAGLQGDEPSRFGVNFFNRVSSGEFGEELASVEPDWRGHPEGDALPHPAINYDAVRANLADKGFPMGDDAGATFAPNAEMMLGTVAMCLFLPESDGSIDANLYDWTTAAQDDIKSQAIAAGSWWSDQARYWWSQVTFKVYWYDAAYSELETGYEPINGTHPSSDEALWQNEIMGNLGFSSGNNFDRITAFNTWLKDWANTDWSYSVWVPYNPAPAPTSFSNGKIGYAYFGGPYTTILYRCNGWLISDWTRILRHETGHIFWACDEYGGSCGSSCSTVCASKRAAYNGNCEDCNTGAVSCIMNHNSLALCKYTPGQIGWHPGGSRQRPKTVSLLNADNASDWYFRPGDPISYKVVFTNRTDQSLPVRTHWQVNYGSYFWEYSHESSLLAPGSYAITVSTSVPTGTGGGSVVHCNLELTGAGREAPVFQGFKVVADQSVGAAGRIQAPEVLSVDITPLD